MRYEVAATLAQELERDIPSEVQLTSCQSMFPSITKFGMAALLLLAAVYLMLRQPPQTVVWVQPSQGDLVVSVVNTRAGTIKS